jgi:hypothetical protein
MKKIQQYYQPIVQVKKKTIVGIAENSNQNNLKKLKPN